MKDPNLQGKIEELQTKEKIEQEIRQRFKEEHPIVYTSLEGAHYILSKTGEAIYVSRELLIEVAPWILLPEVASGTRMLKTSIGIATSAGANIASQKLSGQEFNVPEFAGAVVSGAVSPALKTTKDVVRVNMGIGMGVGLANGGDGLTDGALSGIASYSSSKISNPLTSSVISESIQKIPILKNYIINNENYNLDKKE